MKIDCNKIIRKKEIENIKNFKKHHILCSITKIKANKQVKITIK